MIVKCMSRKAPLFGRLIGYFRRYHGKEAEALPDALGFNLLIDASNHQEVLREFASNFHDYHSHRRNGVVCYHEILSPEPKEVAKLFAEASSKERVAEVQEDVADMLYDLGGKWLTERAPDALGYMQVHGPDADSPHYHLHILLSGNQIASGRAVSLRKPDFLRARDNLWEYTREHYPEIGKFKFDRTKNKAFLREQSRRRSNEKKREKRTRAPSKKQAVINNVRQALENSRDQNALADALRAAGLDMYTRGRTHGVMDTATGKRYRLKTLGLDQVLAEAQKRWERGERAEDPAQDLDPELLALIERQEEERGREPEGRER